MKKLILGLIAAVFISFSANAQTKLSPDVKAVVDAQMVTLVHAAKFTYSKGMTSSEWLKQNTSGSYTKQEEILLQKVFGYLSAGTSDSDILKQDNSILYDVTKTGVSPSPNEPNRFCLRCILQAIKEIIEVILSHLPEN